MTIWWGTVVECLSAVRRIARTSILDGRAERRASDVLDMVRREAVEIEPSSAVRERALRVLALHPLRAADALQLAAALEWCGGRPSGSAFVCLDGRLSEAARREGFEVLPYPDEVHEP